MAKKIVLVAGSLRNQGFNIQIAQKIAELIGDRAEISFLDYADIPYLNQDIEFPEPKEISRVREVISCADGIWFVTPEYNGSYSGVLKNLLDWLSRPLKQYDFAGPSAISGKKVAVSGAAGNSAAGLVIPKLVELLKFIRTEVLEQTTGIALNPEAFTTNIVALSPEQESALRNQAEAFLSFIV